MKKWIFMLIPILILCSGSCAFAFSEVLTHAIKNEEGMFFSYIISFESGKYLITAAQTETGIRICAFDEADGAELTDVIEAANHSNPEIAIVKSEENEYIRISENFYEIEDDTFRSCEVGRYSTVIRIATVKDGKVDTHRNSIGASYNLLNELKEKQIKDYHFIDRRNSISPEALQRLRNIIVSAADIMSYDSKSYDMDTLMRYVLNTHRNFLVAVPYDDVTKTEKDGIMLVDAWYIDYIIKALFDLEPLHPPINELVSKGYCFNGDNYMYTNAFGVSFATDILDIEAVYDIGEGVYYVIFGDIYTENGKSIPEYSYIILKEKENGYNILRLEMGGELLSEREVMRYAGVGETKKYSWETAAAEVPESNYQWVWVCIIAAAAAIVFVMIVCKIRKS